MEGKRFVANTKHNSHPVETNGRVDAINILCRGQWSNLHSLDVVIKYRLI